MLKESYKHSTHDKKDYPQMEKKKEKKKKERLTWIKLVSGFRSLSWCLKYGTDLDVYISVM